MRRQPHDRQILLLLLSCTLLTLMTTAERSAPLIVPCERYYLLRSRFSFWYRNSPPKGGLESDPTGIRTRVFAVRGRCPWPLDDGALPIGRGRFYPTVSTSSKGLSGVYSGFQEHPRKSRLEPSALGPWLKAENPALLAER